MLYFQEEFYQLLEAAEGQARGLHGMTTNVPQYIIGKLGLNRDPLAELQNDLVKSIFQSFLKTIILWLVQI